MMKNKWILCVVTVCFAALFSCKNTSQPPVQDFEIPQITVKTMPLVLGNIEETLTLNGKIVYLKKTNIISPISGYITKINVSYGEVVHANNVVFEIQSKENKALQNSKLNDSSTSSNSGVIKVLAPTNGVINETIIQAIGNFVSEGNLLCSIADNQDLLVQVNVPFQNHKMLSVGASCKIILPDNSKISGSVFQIIPRIDEISQTQQVLVKLNSSRTLPENMNLLVEFTTAAHKSTFIIPKTALSTDEMQRKFWVMKIFNDNLAIEIPVKTGLKNDSLAEIFSSKLAENDLIISEGGYGLPDSSQVKIKQ